MVRRGILLLLLLLLFGCASPPLKEVREPGFSARPEKKTLYVMPFLSVMVPEDVEEGVFDQFVDALNESDARGDYEFVILKGGEESVDADWLSEQNYLTGEIFGYVEDSGCCTTLIRLKSRIRFYQSGHADPTLTLEYPREIFFEHDYSTLEAEKKKLVTDIVETLAERFLSAVTEP